MSGTSRIDFLAGTSGAQTSPSREFKGGKLALGATATAWAGGSVQFQMLLLGTWVNIGAAMTVNGIQVIEVPPGQFQVIATGAGLVGVNASAVVIPTITTR